MQLCAIAFLLLWLTVYQDRNASGRCYYAFLALGLASVLFVQILWSLPLLWILMQTNLMALSWRTWAASVLGVLTPYWAWGSWLLYQGDLTPMGNYLSELIPDITNISFTLPDLPVPQLLSLALATGLIITGTIHFLHKSSGDKIRIRMFFYSFMWLGFTAILFTLLLPEEYDMSFRLMTVCAAPLAGHFIALTNTKATNITFLVLTATTLTITLLNIGLWTS